MDTTQRTGGYCYPHPLLPTTRGAYPHLTPAWFCTQLPYTARFHARCAATTTRTHSTPLRAAGGVPMPDAGAAPHLPARGGRRTPRVPLPTTLTWAGYANFGGGVTPCTAGHHTHTTVRRARAGGHCLYHAGITVRQGQENASGGRHTARMFTRRALAGASTAPATAPENLDIPLPAQGDGRKPPSRRQPPNLFWLTHYCG